VKRKFRVPGQTFADSIGSLIAFIEANPMVRASELAPKFLGISMVPPAKPAEAPAAASAATENPPSGEAPAAPTAPAAEAPKPETNLTLDERAKLSRMQGDLMWLVREGYVTEFIDGRLFAPPPMVEARKKEIESEEHDPENFPEAPPSTEGSAAAPPAPAANEATSESVESPAAETPAPSEAPAAEESPMEERKPEPPAPASSS
jgi:hypothetical protein